MKENPLPHRLRPDVKETHVGTCSDGASSEEMLDMGLSSVPRSVANI